MSLIIKSMSSLPCIWTSHCSKFMLKSVTAFSFVIALFALATLKGAVAALNDPDESPPQIETLLIPGP